MAKTEPKPRPIIRIGYFIISHSLLVSVICVTSGIFALLLLPVLAKSTYISENALMPGSASPMLTSGDAMNANSFVKEITSLNLKPEDAGIEIPRLIAQHMTDLGGEVGHHKFLPQLNNFHPLHFFSNPDTGIVEVNSTCSSFGINTIGIIRAPRGDGKEAIVLVTPYNSLKVSPSEALSLGVAYSVFSLLTRVSWLAKDVIWLASDSRHGEYESVAAWLRDYHAPSFIGSSQFIPDTCQVINTHVLEITDSFRRAGTMAAALVIKVSDISGGFEKDALTIFAEASNGQMPNLDLINIVNYLAVHGQGLRVKVEKLFSLLDNEWLRLLGQVLEAVGKFARNFNPQWKFGIPVVEYIEGTATLVSSLYNQAMGVPTGPHGAFRDYQVDAITMEISPPIYKAREIDFLLRGGRLVEGVIRSVNNLLEKFHQSFFLYLLTSPSKFVSVGVYMIAFGLLVAPLPVLAASLYSDANNSNSSLEKDKQTSFRSWRWIYAAKTVFVVHLWGAIVTLLPYFITQIPNTSPTTSLVVWALLSVVSLLVLHLVFSSSSSHLSEWALLKSVTVSTAFIGLCVMSVINFATAEIGALLIVPLCLLVVPLKLNLKVCSGKAIVRATCNVVLVLSAFPAGTFFAIKGAFEGFDNISVGDFWYWLESLWAWNSASYIFICMVHLPCWVLCIQILLHSC